MAAYELHVDPNADREFDEFVKRDRSTAFDVGSHFRVLEGIVNDGLAEWMEMGLKLVSTDGGCRLYAYTGSKLKMFMAVHERTLLLVHFSMLGSEHDLAARAIAVNRMKGYFGI